MKLSNLFKNNFKLRELDLAEAQLYDAKMQATTFAQELMLKQAMVAYADNRVRYLKSLVATIKGETHEEDNTASKLPTTSLIPTKKPFSY